MTEKTKKISSGASISYFLLASVSALAISTTAQAQDEQGGDAIERDDTIVVTATRRETAITDVPASIAVVSRDEMVGLGVDSAEELGRVDPSLTVTNGNSSGGSTITIRGLTSGAGSPTVGVFLDDVPITRRANGSTFQGNGTAFPQFFDLERVEVLRGPQGTLYGGSSIGGTIRLVLPQPSLDDVRIRALAEGAVTKDGDPSYEVGASFGAPIIPGKLGLQASVYGRSVGGYIDHVSRFDGSVLDENTNDVQAISGRIAFLYRANDRFDIKPSVYYSRNTYKDSDQYWTNVDGYSLPARPSTSPFFPFPPAHPAADVPAYDVFGPYRTGNNCNVGEDFQDVVEECVLLEERNEELLVPSLTLTYDLGDVQLKSVTSYTHDLTTGNKNNSFQDLFLFGPFNGTGVRPFIPTIELYRNPFLFENDRSGVTQELQLTGNIAERIDFVAGVFYQNFDNTTLGQWTGNLDALFQGLQGRDAIDVFGINTFPEAHFTRESQQTEEELAFFADVTVGITNRLNLLAGVRFSDIRFAYREETFGTTVRRTVATDGFGLTEGEINETAVSPKAGLQYYFDDANMAYATATRGYRPGGVAPAPIGPACDAELASLGFPDIPAIPYESDSVWSYEIGTKLQPFDGRVSIDASAYRVEWKDTQVNARLNCRSAFIANAASMTSQGVDVGMVVQLHDYVTLNGAVSYVDATFEELTLQVSGIETLFIRDGDAASVPDLSFRLGAQFEMPVSAGLEIYGRADFQYTGDYPRGFGSGTNGFSPDVYIAEPTEYLSMRAGFRTGAWDVSLFVDNVLNSQDDRTVATNTGRRNCSFNADLSLAGCAFDTGFIAQTTFRPRTIGITTRLRY